jgi:hypothetical protein
MNDHAIESVDDNDDLATLLARREHARPNRLTWVLLVLVVLTVGFIGGAFIEKRNASSGTAPNFAALRGGGGFAGAGGAGGAAPGGQGAAAAPAGTTTGTVKLVDGQNLYVTDAAGNTVKVIVPDTASITSQVDASLTDLTAGTTVVINGEPGADGTVTATSVSEDATPTTVATPSPSPTIQGDN